MMNKQMIKETWGNICDTDKLVDDMMALLSKYGHRNSEHGVCTILQEFFTNKKQLIDMIAQSANYKGDLRIIRDEAFERECVSDDIRKFVDSFMNKEGVKNCIVKYSDADGKTMHDYIRIGSRTMNLKQMTSAVSLFNTDALKKFDLNTGATMESMQKLRDFNVWMSSFSRIYCSSLVNDHAYSGVKLASGMKTSRAFNKVCAHYGVDKWNMYNKEFAKYADMVSGKERTLKFIISVNPLDYLTMSFGKSWASCHTIDKRNVRRMENGYHGMYCNGTLSYMMDGSSIITYVLDDIGENMHEIGKVYRNMFHVNVDSQLCIQGRIYPQGNDGSTDLYKKFRFIMQEELTKMFGLESNKWKSRSVIGEDARSTGNHYQDYFNYSSCKAFYPSAKEGQALNRIEIGHIGICPRCGNEHRTAEYLSHDYDCEIPSEDSHTETEAANTEVENVTLHATVDNETLEAIDRAVREARANEPEHMYTFNGFDITTSYVPFTDANRRSYRNLAQSNAVSSDYIIYGDSVRGRSQVIDENGIDVGYAYEVGDDHLQELLDRARAYTDLRIHEELARVANENGTDDTEEGESANRDPWFI